MRFFEAVVIYTITCIQYIVPAEIKFYQYERILLGACNRVWNKNEKLSTAKRLFLNLSRESSMLEDRLIHEVAFFIHTAINA